MRPIPRAAISPTDTFRRALAALGVALVLVVVVQAGRDRGDPADRILPSAELDGPAGADPQARCSAAVALVTSHGRWPVTCRWRRATDALQGQAFPPPAGPAPFDLPHVEIYVEPHQSTEDLARAIAHEFGHMHHTREFLRLPDWLQARGLPADTPVEVWTEDYAEVFAALFAPPTDRWRAPTPRPAPETLVRLRSAFFGEA